MEDMTEEEKPRCRPRRPAPQEDPMMVAARN